MHAVQLWPARLEAPCLPLGCSNASPKSPRWAPTRHGSCLALCLLGHLAGASSLDRSAAGGIAPQLLLHAVVHGHDVGCRDTNGDSLCWGSSSSRLVAGLLGSTARPYSPDTIIRK